MKIYDKSSWEALWEIVKPLQAEIPIYKEVMDEDEDSVPNSYLLIRRDVTDGGRIYGDGKAQTRQSNCDLILVSKSKGKSAKDIHSVNIERVKSVLDQAEIDYDGYNLGYNDTQKQSEYTWSINVNYG